MNQVYDSSKEAPRAADRKQEDTFVAYALLVGGLSGLIVGMLLTLVAVAIF